jgi:hypothetical protein
MNKEYGAVGGTKIGRRNSSTQEILAPNPPHPYKYSKLSIIRGNGGENWRG